MNSSFALTGIMLIPIAVVAHWRGVGEPDRSATRTIPQ